MAHPISIHHINFIVADLEESVAQYQNLLGLGAFEVEDLPERGARTARIQLDGTWLVLVSPTRPDSVPGRFLAARGEGFFLLSFGVSDLDDALADYEARGTLAPGSKIRSGLMDWRVIDLQTEDTLGSMFHLTEVKPEQR
jgi:methylmalonyl-CoA/ethylmalonyl-CoA epimerase